MDLLDHSQSLAKSWGVAGTVESPQKLGKIIPKDWMGIHPYQFKAIKIWGKTASVVFSIHPLLLGKLKIKGQISMAIFDLTIFGQSPPAKKFRYSPLPRFPHSSFDYTLTLAKTLSVEKIFQALNKIKDKRIKSHSIVQIYPQDQAKHITMRTIFFDQEKTFRPRS